ncbi:MAG: ribose 5-phosphate isomerase B [bacterium]
MKIVIGSDHAGFELKKHIRQFLNTENITFKDCGTDSSDSVDYPDIAVKTAKLYIEKKYDYGILICGSGIGMSIVSNKIKGVRAALCNTSEMARLARTHNNANILCLGARIVEAEKALNIITEFLFTEFSNKNRHQKRINKIHKLTGV